jgi:metal-responsive CopG/Arc/MetJ family transcriptional regulator
MGQFNSEESLMSFFINERVIVHYEIDEDRLYHHIKNLSYKEYKSFRSDFISEAVNKYLVTDTNEAKQKFWERLISSFKEKYGFVTPVSDNPDAIRKRYQRSA